MREYYLSQEQFDVVKAIVHNALQYQVERFNNRYYDSRTIKWYHMHPAEAHVISQQLIAKGIGHRVSFDKTRFGPSLYGSITVYANVEVVAGSKKIR